jgi:hypothetical protein
MSMTEMPPRLAPLPCSKRSSMLVNDQRSSTMSQAFIWSLDTAPGVTQTWNLQATFRETVTAATPLVAATLTGHHDYPTADGPLEGWIMIGDALRPA